MIIDTFYLLTNIIANAKTQNVDNPTLHFWMPAIAPTVAIILFFITYFLDKRNNRKNAESIEAKISIILIKSAKTINTLLNNLQDQKDALIKALLTNESPEKKEALELFEIILIRIQLDIPTTFIKDLHSNDFPQAIETYTLLLNIKHYLTLLVNDSITNKENITTLLNLVFSDNENLKEIISTKQNSTS